MMRPAIADQSYDVSGMDSYAIGASVPATQIAYVGTQRLLVAKSGTTMRFEAQARYTRTDDSSKASVRAHFVQELVDGSFHDRADDDPDFLTILNQPFAVQLDRVTLRDLRTLHHSVPFQASSPLGSAMLHGFLRPSSGGRINGKRVIGVRFEADGPMTGPLPERADTTIAGTIRMDGTAYYSLDSALLLALDATLTITGKLVDKKNAVPVRIVYRRNIRADDSIASWNAAQSP